MNKNISTRFKSACLGKTLLCVMLVFIFAASGWVATAAEAVEFGGGDGSAESPYLISTPAQLDKMREYTGSANADKNFRLTCDIDLTEYLSAGNAGYNGGKGWKPIGDALGVNYFAGNLDGGGFTVSGLRIDRPDEWYVGFFCVARGAKIRNLGIVLDDEKGGITGGTFTGGLAASVSGCIFEKCAVAGNVASVGVENYYSLGGLFGQLSASSVLQCMFKGSVTYSVSPSAEDIDYVLTGGLAGWTFGPVTITDCYIGAAITGGDDDYTAGLVGTGSGVNNIENCYIEHTGGQCAYPFYGSPMAMMSGGIINSYYAGAFGDGLPPDLDEVPFDIDAKRLDEITKDALEGFNFETVWGFDRDGNLVLRAFGKAYDPPNCGVCNDSGEHCPACCDDPDCEICNPPPPYIPPPPNLTWVWITLGGAGFAAAVCAVAVVLYRRKKFVTVTETVHVEKEVIKEVEVPMIKKPLPDDLSEQERRVAEFILKGKSRREIAREMKLSENTVGTYTARVFTKAGVDGAREFIVQYL